MAPLTLSRTHSLTHTNTHMLALRVWTSEQDDLQRALDLSLLEARGGGAGRAAGDVGSGGARRSTGVRGALPGRHSEKYFV